MKWKFRGQEERIYLSGNKFSLEHSVTRLLTNKPTFSYVVYYESFKGGKDTHFTPFREGKQNV